MVTEPVAVRAHPDWQRWRCDLIDNDAGRAGLPPAGVVGLGHHSVELRRSRNGGALLLAARAQARLDGHAGVVSVHRARPITGGSSEVRLGWAGATLARVMARRWSPPTRNRALDEHITDHGRSVAPAGRAPGLPLPVADLMTVGATVATTLDAAHRLHPPLVHGALDATAIRLDRWGRARLDGFGGRCAGRSPPGPADDVYGLLVTLGDALGLERQGAALSEVGLRHHRAAEANRSTRPEPSDPAAALISTLLASVTRRRPDIIDAGDLGRALESLAARYSDAATRLPAAIRPPAPDPVPVSAHPGQHRSPDDAPSADGDLTMLLGARAEPRRGGPLPDRLCPVAPLGQGGHGEVWLAHDPLLARNVVVKEFPPDPVDGTFYPAPMARELIAMGELAGHPASIECYGAVAGERPALVLSWCSEGTLDPERHWSPTELAMLGAQVADALAVLHGRQLVHGDIKPHNLLRDRWGSVRLADFSLTGPSGDPGPPECSPRHAPPEQLDGGMLNPRADLAALAATLFHLAEGRPPLDRGDGTEALVARRRAGALETPPASLEALPGLSDWVMAWLRPDPNQRPSGGATVAAATLRALYRPDSGDASVGVTPTRRHRQHRQHRQHHRASNRRAVMLAVTVVAILAAGTLAFRGSGPGTVRSDSGRSSVGGRSHPATDSDAVARAIDAARRLPPADPLDAEMPAGLTLDRRSGETLLIRDGDPAPQLSWVLRRDDFVRSHGIVEDHPSASGLAGPDGSIDGPGPVLRPGAERSAVLADFAGASCVRVVTSSRPPEVSAPLCWG